MGAKHRAKAKKTAREFKKSNQRKSIEKSFNASSPQTHAPSPSPDHILNKTKCVHLKRGIKLKKLGYRMPKGLMKCSAESCPPNNSTDKSLIWICLHCQSQICDKHLVNHEHDIFVRFPISSTQHLMSLNDFDSIISEGMVRFFCTKCDASVCPSRNRQLFDAISAIKKSMTANPDPDPQNNLLRSAIIKTESLVESPPTSRQVSVHAGKSRPATGRNELDPAIALALGVRGIRNLGNTCYAASLLQCLTHARHLKVPLLNESTDMDSLSLELFTFLRSMRASDVPSIFHAGKLLVELGRRFKEFRSFQRQNDSHEMLRCLFDVMDSEHVKRYEALANKSDKDNDKVISSPEASIVAKAFRSQVSSCIECMSCHKSQSIPEVFFDLALTVSSSLTSSIAQFFSDDLVDCCCENTSCPSHCLPATVTSDVSNSSKNMSIDLDHDTNLHSCSSQDLVIDLDQEIKCLPSELPSLTQKATEFEMNDHDDTLSMDLDHEFKIMDLNINLELDPTPDPNLLQLEEEKSHQPDERKIMEYNEQEQDSPQTSEHKSAISEEQDSTASKDEESSQPKERESLRTKGNKLTASKSHKIKDSSKRRTSSRPKEQKLTNSEEPTVPQPTVHVKRYIITSLASTLCLTLKRTRQSKNIRVDFPLYIENDGTFPDVSSYYELFAIIEHVGTMNFGHYTAYIKVHQPYIDNLDHVKNKSPDAPGSSAVWIHADDERLTQVSEKQVLQCSPYLLFYQTQTPS